jgi:hypothetical protein
LYLIRRQNLDVLDIPVAEITRQYVEYITVMRELRFELAAEYLVMAAILAEVKSRQGQLPGLPAGQPPTPIQQFMALQAMPVMHVEAELQHSQIVLMTLLTMEMDRTGMVFQTLSNLSKARHDIRRNSISNIR